MSHTHAANFVHCVFSTKDRRDLIPAALLEKSGVACDLERLFAV